MDKPTPQGGSARSAHNGDHGKIDAFLQQRAFDPRYETHGRRRHAGARKGKAGNDALQLYGSCPPGDGDSPGQIGASLSGNMTTSAASDEALAPQAPIATPTDAVASVGASLTPSPIIIVC